MLLNYEINNDRNGSIANCMLLHKDLTDKLDEIEIAIEFISVNSWFVLILTHCYVCTTASNPRDRVFAPPLLNPFLHPWLGLELGL